MARRRAATFAPTEAHGIMRKGEKLCARAANRRADGFIALCLNKKFGNQPWGQRDIVHAHHDFAWVWCCNRNDDGLGGG